MSDPVTSVAMQTVSSMERLGAMVHRRRVRNPCKDPLKIITQDSMLIVKQSLF